MKKRILPVILPVTALLLELLPYGAVCVFANPEGEPWRRTYSYFDLLPFGYANFAPFITALLTCVGVLAAAVYLFSGREKAATLAQTVLAVAGVISLGPLLYGLRFYSAVGLLITVALLAGFAVMRLHIRRIRQT